MQPPPGWVGPALVAGAREGRKRVRSGSSSRENELQIRPQERRRQLEAASSSSPAQFFVDTSRRLQAASGKALASLLKGSQKIRRLFEDWPAEQCPRNILMGAIRCASAKELAEIHGELINFNIVFDADSCANQPLPNDVFGKILSMLSVQEVLTGPLGVCKAWFDVANSEFFWSEVEVLTLSIIPPRDVFFPLLKKLKQLRSIDASSSGVDEFYGRPTFDDMDLKNLSNYCEKLTTLSLDRCESLSDNGLRHLQPFKNLDSLSLENCTNISSDGIKEVVKCCRRLRQISIRGNYKITDAGLQIIAFGCRNLLKLDCSRCRAITDEAMNVLGMYSRSNLTSLDVHHCNQLTDQGMESIALCKSLTSLDISFCTRVTDNGLRILCGTFPAGANAENTGSRPTRGLEKLTRLSLGGCTNVTDLGVSALGALPFLREAYIFNCLHITEGVLDSLARHPTLCEVNLDGCQLLSEKRLEKFFASLQLKAGEIRQEKSSAAGAKQGTYM